jgi:tetratricopeptide (TPR) repeat protein
MPTNAGHGKRQAWIRVLLDGLIAALITLAFALPAMAQTCVRGPGSPWGCPGDSSDDGESEETSSPPPTYSPPPVYRPPQPSPQELAQRQANAINEQGIALARRGDHRGALAKYEQAARIDPSNAVIRNNVLLERSVIPNEEGYALFGRGDYEGALAKFREAVKLYPGNRVARGNMLHALGKLASLRHDCRDALNQYKASIQTNPSNRTNVVGDLDNALACVKAEKLQDDADQRLKKDTERRVALNNFIENYTIGASFARAGDFNAAITMTEQALSHLKPVLNSNSDRAEIAELYTKARRALEDYKLHLKTLDDLDKLTASSTPKDSDAYLAQLREIVRNDSALAQAKVRLTEALWRRIDSEPTLAGQIALLKEIDGLGLSTYGDANDGAIAQGYVISAKRRLAELEALEAAHLPTSLMRVAPPPPGSWASTPAEAAKRPAIVEISPETAAKLDEAWRRVQEKAKEKIEDDLKEKVEEKAKEKIVEAIPVSEELKQEGEKQAGLIARFKELYGDMKRETDAYLLGWHKLSKDSLACLANPNANCEKEMLASEEIANDHADKASHWWKPWLKDDIEAHK